MTNAPLNQEHIMRIVGVDPGDERSAYVVLLNGQPDTHGWIPNSELLEMLRDDYVGYGIMAIETLHPRHELASREAMETQLWAGRYVEAVSMAGTSFQQRWVQVAEYDSRCAVTGRTNSTNAQVREALLSLFGGDRKEACDRCHASGTVMGVRKPKKCPQCKGNKFVRVPGLLSGYGEHERSALAAAYWYFQKNSPRQATA